MIKISDNVFAEIDNYVNYLINSGETDEKRAHEKKRLMIQSLMNNLSNPISFKRSAYKELGSDEGCRLFVYTDKWTKTTKWGFAYKFDRRKNIAVCYMKNMQLVANTYSNVNQPLAQNTGNQNQKINQPQQNQSNQITWRFLKNKQYQYGFTIVQATNYYNLYNFVDKNKKILCPSAWFKTCEDFKTWNNGVIAARVTIANGTENGFLDNKGNYYKVGKGYQQLKIF